MGTEQTKQKKNESKSKQNILYTLLYQNNPHLTLYPLVYITYS